MADEKGYGWAICKSLAASGARVSAGVWVPALTAFQKRYDSGRMDSARALPGGGSLNFENIYGLDATFDTPEAVPLSVAQNTRYSNIRGGFTVSEVAEAVTRDMGGGIDIVVHAVANAPEVSKPLLETSRDGYLSAQSASTYSFISMVQRFGPFMPTDGSFITLSYEAATRVVEGYGGGMCGAKASLESSVRVLAAEAGRRHGVRVNAISPGPLNTRAARAIGPAIDRAIEATEARAPLQRSLKAEDVGRVAAFLASPMAAAVTGQVILVDNGFHVLSGVPGPDVSMSK